MDSELLLHSIFVLIQINKWRFLILAHIPTSCISVYILFYRLRHATYGIFCHFWMFSMSLVMFSVKVEVSNVELSVCTIWPNRQDCGNIVIQTSNSRTILWGKSSLRCTQGFCEFHYYCQSKIKFLFVKTISYWSNNLLSLSTMNDTSDAQTAHHTEELLLWKS
jgi:hypothetical protein